MRKLSSHAKSITQAARKVATLEDAVSKLLGQLEAKQALLQKARQTLIEVVDSKPPGPFIICIQRVMQGQGPMNTKEIYAELKARGWLPNSSDPLGFIRYTLSVTKNTFLRVEGQRGYYVPQSNEVQH